MSEVIYVLKTAILAFIFILLMQIKVGEITLENRLSHWIRTSPVSQNLQASAAGAAMTSKELYFKAKNKIEQTFK